MKTALYTIVLFAVITVLLPGAAMAAPSQDGPQDFFRSLPAYIQRAVNAGLATITQVEYHINVSTPTGRLMKNWQTFIARNYPGWRIIGVPTLASGRYVVTIARWSVIGRGVNLLLIPKGALRKLYPGCNAVFPCQG